MREATFLVSFVVSHWLLFELKKMQLPHLSFLVYNSNIDCLLSGLANKGFGAKSKTGNRKEQLVLVLQLLPSLLTTAVIPIEFYEGTV